MSEFHDQCAVIEWAEWQSGKYPELHLLNASLNGLRLPIGLAVKAKRMGMKRGYPDLSLPVKRGEYGGLYIEMKAGKNKTTPEQKEWMDKLRGQGHAAMVCRGAQEAIDALESYLTGG